MEKHIEIAKEDISAIEYAFQSFPGSPKPPDRNRDEHGSVLKDGLSRTVNTITSNRQEMGVDAESLLVLQLSSCATMPDVDLLQSKLQLAIVEEVKN